MKILDRPSIKKRPMILFIAILILIIFLPAAYYLTTHPFGAKAAWFDNRWGYRQRIDITNTSATLQENYQVFFTIDTTDTTKFNNNCADIRLIDATGNQLPHWIEENNPGCGDAATTIWTKLSVPSSGTFIYIYYGNPSAQDVADDGTGVFELIDNFNDSVIDTTKWTVSTVGSGTVVEEAGYIKLDSVAGSGNHATLASVNPITPGFRVRWSSNFVTDRNNQWHLSDVSAHIDQDGIRYIDYVGNANAEYQKTIGGVYSTIQEEAKKAIGLHTITLAIATTGFASYTVDDNTYTTTGLTAANIEHIFNYAQGEVSGKSEYWNDWVVVTKFVEDGPAAAAPTNEEKSPAPVAYWKLDEGYGTTANDSTGHGFTGSLTDTPVWQTEDLCVSGKCLFFNGTSNNVDMGTSAALDITGPMTVSGWFKVKDPSGSTSQFIASKDFSTGNRGWGLAVASGKLVFEKGGSNLLTGSTPLQASVWYHAAVIFNGTTWKLYLNGSEEDSEAGTGSLDNTDAKFMIGARHFVGVENYLNGFIDDVKVYNYGRSVAQIKTDYNAGKSHAATSTGASVSFANNDSNDALSRGLAAYWKMDEASGDALDSSGNTNTATPTGTSIVTGKFGHGRQTTDSNYLSVASSASLSFGRVVSFSAWVYETSYPAAGLGRIVGRSDSSFEFAIDSAASTICGEGIVAIYTPQTNWTCTTYTLPLNTWRHLTATFDGSKWRVFANGALVWTNTITSGINIAGSTIIGAATGGTEGFPGTIDEVRFYNRSLQPSEVKFLYNFAPGPVGYWKFDEKTGTVTNDTSSNGYTGTFNGTPTWTTGKFGSSLNFNGSNSYISTSLEVSPAEWGELTMEAWVYPNADATDFDAIADGDDGGYDRGFGVRTADYEVQVGDQAWQPGPTHDIGRWQHVAVTYSANQISFYKNGVRYDYGSGGNFGTSSQPLLIGQDIPCGSCFYDGRIDEVKVYNYARTPSQIVEDMNAGHPIGGSPVGSQIGYWKFDEGYGATANDSSPQTVNGTITDATWKNAGKFGKALFFDGDGDYVTLGDVAAYKTDTKTITFWANPSAGPSSTVGVVSADNVANWYVGFTVNGRMISSHSVTAGTQQTTSSPINIVPGKEWHYYAYVWDVSGSNVTVKQYKDGSKVTDTTYTTGYSGTYGSNFILGSFATGSLFYSGLLDEVKIYNSALTDNQIKLDFNRGSAQVLGTLSDTSALSGGSVASSSAGAAYCVPGSSTGCTSPILEWNLEDPTGQTINDTSESGNNGTGNNSTPVQGKIGKARRFTAGNNGRIVSDSNLGLTGTDAHTVCAWTKSINSVDRKAVFTVGEEAGGPVTNGYGFTLIDATLEVHLPNVGTIMTVDLQPADWNYLCSVYDGTVHYAYVNGRLSAQVTRAYDLNDFPLNVARWFVRVDSTYDYTGSIDQVKVYDYARSSSQIAWDYNRGAPIGWWKFDECQGITMNDATGYGNPGTWIGAGGSQTAVGTCSTPDTAWGNGAVGKFNSSINLDGTDDYIEIPDPASGAFDWGTGDFSLSAWIKTSDTSGRFDIFNKSATGEASYGLYWGSTSSFIFHTDDGLGDNDIATWTSPDITDNLWHHLVAIRSGSDMFIYRDGSLVASSTGVTVHNLANTGDLCLGKHCVDNDFFLNGSLDDVRVFNYALTPNQIKATYNQGSGVRYGPETGIP